MLRHLVYAAFAVILGVVIMILPLMMFSYQDYFTRSGQPQLGEAEKASTAFKEEGRAENVTSKENISISVFQRSERLTSRFVSSFPYAMVIVVTGLAVAMAVFILAKRRLL